MELQSNKKKRRKSFIINRFLGEKRLESLGCKVRFKGRIKYI